MKYEVHYWDKPGKENTEATIDAALKRAKESDIKDFVVASCAGSTAKMLCDKGRNAQIRRN